MEDRLLSILEVLPDWAWAVALWTWLIKGAWPSSVTIKRKDK